MSLVIGIISYLPKDEAVREKRLKAHRAQLEWLDGLFDLSLEMPEMWIVAQNYRDGDYVADYEDGTALYLDYPYSEIQKMPGFAISNARNVLLDRFYDSGFDYMLLLDDDALLYPYYEVERFLDAAVTTVWPELDMVIGVSPMTAPFKRGILDDWQRQRANWIFRCMTPGQGDEIRILKNIVKFGHEPIRYRPDLDPGKGEGYEMFGFWCDWVLAGHSAYELSTMILKKLNLDISTWAGVGKEVRNELHRQNVTAFVRKYVDSGIQTDGRTIKLRRFQQMHNRSEGELVMPHDDFELEMDEIYRPKERKSKNPARTGLFD